MTNGANDTGMPAGAPQPAGQPAPGGGSPEETAKQAIAYIYQDGETFETLVQMLDSNKSDPSTGIAQATVMIIEKLDADMGGNLSVEDLSTAGAAVIASLIDLAATARIIPGLNKESAHQLGADAWQKAIQIFMKNNPGRIDPAHLQNMAQEAQAPGAPAGGPPAPQAPGGPGQGLLGAA